MTAKSVGSQKFGLLKCTEESVLLKNAQDKQKVLDKKKQLETLAPYLHKDCVSNILVRLPLEYLQRSRFVCKPWYNIVNSPIFIETHLRRSETVFIFTTSTSRSSSFSSSTSSIPPEKPNTVSVEAKYLQTEYLPFFIPQTMGPTSKFLIQFLEFKAGKINRREYSLSCFGRIRATCNGLILLDNILKQGGLIVTNPVTRKVTSLPPGTIFPCHKESYGFAFSNVSGKYKVVHLFEDDSGFVNCEILLIGTRIWRAVDGPFFCRFDWLRYKPVSAIGGLHWVPRVDHSDCIVTMEVEKEKFHKLMLPKNRRTHDIIVEMGGVLSFVTREEGNRIDIWILKGLFGEEWTKKHSIIMECVQNMVPLLSLKIKGDLIFREKNDLFYAYDFELQVMRKLEMVNGCFGISGSLFPHVNSLVSWSSRESTRDFCD